MRNIAVHSDEKVEPREQRAAMFPRWLRRLRYYGLALLFVAAAAALRAALPEVLGPTPFLAFYLAWVGAAAFGGLGPGLLATAASWLCIDLLFDPTNHLINFANWTTVGRLVVLLAGGLAVSLVAETMRRGRIREQRQARELADLVQLTRLGQFMIRDDQDRIVLWSDGCTRLYGFTAEQAVGRISHELLRTEFPQPKEAICAAFRETGRWEGELVHHRADGTPVNVASLWVLGDSTPNAALEVNTDITGRKQAEEALHGANERLREQAEELVAINEDLEQFAYVASHDLQEPLRAVGGFVTLLQQRYKGRLDEKADSYINAAVEGVSRMQSLINGLLEYSRVGTRGGVPAPAQADEALLEALKNLQVLIQESGAVITSDPLPRVQADARQLTHLFQNLIANAIKFRSACPPAIQVGSRREDGAWLFWVRDNGIGIEPQYRERIFLIFQRLHTRSQYPGTGIGLAICKRIVERHGGHIWVESQPGQGSTFYFTLPDKGQTHEPSAPQETH